MFGKYTAAITVILVILLIPGGCAVRPAGTPSTETERASTMEGYTSGINPAHISSGEAWTLVGADSAAIVLDVRSEASFLERHVSIAKNVPYEQVADYARANIPDRDSVIICYCFCGDKGGPALSACETLAGLGYTNAYYMEPEDEWEYEGLPQDDITEEETVHRVISGQEAKEMYDSDSAAILLDVRNRDEYAAGHIDGSTLIPLPELEDRLSELSDKNAVIIVYCRSGVRSAAAYSILSENGYTNIYDMQKVASWPG